VLTILFFLVLGAIVNVAVAWGLAIVTGPITYDCRHPFLNSVGNSPVVCITSRPGCEVVRLCARGGTLMANREVPDYPAHPWWNEQILTFEPRWAIAYGLPMLSMKAWRETYWIRINGDDMGRSRMRDGYSFRSQPWAGGSQTIYPVLAFRPIWPGFLLNTLFYALILWLLILGPFMLRRFIRIRRGRCPKCGYDLRGAEHHRCPECGTAVPRAWQARADTA
jgi:hypothetical protein